MLWLETFAMEIDGRVHVALEFYCDQDRARQDVGGAVGKDVDGGR
jgi:hypothetical protein